MSIEEDRRGALLIVDDNEMNRDMLSRRLKRHGHTVTTAEDGYQALKLIESQTFDAVLLDIAMPGIDGLETLTILRKTHSATSLPVVMATAMDQSVDIVKALKLGANDYVTKPLDFPVVLARVEGQLLLKWAVDRIKKLEKDLEQRNNELEAANARISADNQRIKQQKKEVEQLLDSALTPPVARAMREKGSFPPVLDEVCVIEVDIVGFSKVCESIPAKMVVEELNRFYNDFDKCCLQYNVEPLRSQGDSRIAVAGLHNNSHKQHGLTVIDAVLAMLAFRKTLAPVDSLRSSAEGKKVALWSARIGVHSGPTMIGVMKGTRLCLDVWGDTVNMAARLEQGAAPNQIMISDRALWATRGLFDHGPIQQKQVKNTRVSGAMVRGICEPFRDEQGQPSEKFWEIYHDPDYRVIQPDPAGSGPCRDRGVPGQKG